MSSDLRSRIKELFQSISDAGIHKDVKANLKGASEIDDKEQKLALVASVVDRIISELEHPDDSIDTYQVRVLALALASDFASISGAERVAEARLVEAIRAARCEDSRSSSNLRALRTEAMLLQRQSEISFSKGDLEAAFGGYRSILMLDGKIQRLAGRAGLTLRDLCGTNERLADIEVALHNTGHAIHLYRGANTWARVDADEDAGNKDLTACRLGLLTDGTTSRGKAFNPSQRVEQESRVSRKLRSVLGDGYFGMKETIKSLTHRSSRLEREGDLEGQREVTIEAVELLRTMARMPIPEGEEDWLNNELAENLMLLAAFELELQRPMAAVSASAAATDLWGGPCDGAERWRRIPHDYESALLILARAQIASGDPENAMATANRAMGVCYSRLLSLGPTPRLLSLLARVTNVKGMIAKASGDEKMFARWVLKAGDLIEAAVGLDPSDEGARTILLDNLSIRPGLLRTVYAMQLSRLETEAEKAVDLSRSLCSQSTASDRDWGLLASTVLSFGDIKFQLGKREEAVALWLESARSLTLLGAQRGTFLETAVALAVRLGKAPRICHVDVHQIVRVFPTIWEKVSRSIELRPTEHATKTGPLVSRFLGAWVRFVLEHEPKSLPTVLAAMQGRKIAQMALDDLEKHAPTNTEDAALLERFCALRRELRVTALGLQVLEGGLSGASPEDFRGFLDPLAGSKTRLMRTRQEESDSKLAEYYRIRAELSTRPGLSAIDPQEMYFGRLQYSLGRCDAVLLLVQTPCEKQLQPWAVDGLAPAYALLLRSDGHTLLPVPELAKIPRRMQFTATQYSRMAGVRDVAGAVEQVAEQPAQVHDAPLSEHLAQALWVPLREHLQGVRVLHVVTHGEFHVLPLQALAPEGLEVRSYPGAVFYWLQHLAKQRALDPPEPAIAVQVHSPEPGASPPPIPFVDAEAGVLAALWPQVHTAVPLAESRVLAVVHLAGHGDAGTGGDASLLIGPQERLGLHQVLGGQLRAPIVYLSACLVGRTLEIDGEPLGLVSAFMLKGVRSVVAPLVPIPDRYAPVLAALWHWDIVQQIQAGEPPDAHRALGWAKARLRDGRWPDQVLQLLLQNYAKTMAKEIELRYLEKTAENGKADVFVVMRNQFEEWLGDEASAQNLLLPCCVDIELAQPQELPGVIGQAASALAGHMLGERESFAGRAEVRALLDFVQVYGAADSRGGASASRG